MWYAVGVFSADEALSKAVAWDTFLCA